MPLLTPETSSSSRDSVTILTSSVSLPSRSHPQEPSKRSFGGKVNPHCVCTSSCQNSFNNPSRRDTVVILGPFEPQTHDLASSDSDSSSNSQSSPQVSRTRTPIAVPIPRYEDCFEAPWVCGFDQMSYELSSPDLCVEGSQSPNSSDSFESRQPWEPDHWRIVKDRVEATVGLFLAKY
jgi:hypothetical protein